MRYLYIDKILKMLTFITLHIVIIDLLILYSFYLACERKYQLEKCK